MAAQVAENPWLTSSLLNSYKRKNKLYKISLTLKTDETVAKYKAYKNKLNHLLRISERKYYYEINLNWLKEIWEALGN